MENTEARKPKTCVVVSSPMTVAAFLRDQIREVGGRYDLFVAANAPNGDFLDGLPARFLPVPVERKILPLADLWALVCLYRLFRRERFDLVQSVTPKAGLLAMAAAFFARVPVRVHTFTGQVWATKSGAVRTGLRLLDTIMAGFATRVLVDSFSQRQFLIENRVVSEEKSSVLGMGSISGVDTIRFHPDPGARHALREKCGIPSGDVVFIYVGRLNRDKGIPELIIAFEHVAERIPGTWLLVVGPDEESMEALMDRSPARPRMVRVGYTTTPETFLAAADIFVLPSHREGFGSTVIEAAAAGIPSIASRIYGLTDAVADGQTGLLHTSGAIDELAEAMARLAGDPNERRRMGAAARTRAETEFAMPKVTANTLAFYASALAETRR